MRCVWIFALSLVLHAFPASAADDGGIDENIADSLAIAIPVGAYGLTWLKGDGEGGWQCLKSTGTALGTTLLLKLALNNTTWGERPNEKSYGFPSGHAAAIVSGATFLFERYGWKYGVPAAAAAAFVIHERVDDRKHKWRDVIGGTAIGWLSATVFTTRYLPPAVDVTPLMGEQLGLHVEVAF